MSFEIRAIAITVSDSRKVKNDVSGQVLFECLKEIGAKILDRIIVRDDLETLTETLLEGSKRANLVITTGGTGLAESDITPEATLAVIKKMVPGLAEAMRQKSLEKTPFGMLSRGVCGLRDNCLIINLPGSPKAVRECFEVLKPVLPHAINLMEGETTH
jgi:molybdopterin adenylyltransferase